MSEPLNTEPLLADVLAEGRDAGLRETLLSETLRLVRRRRRFARARRAVLSLAVVAACALLFWRYGSHTPVGRGNSRPYLLVLTEPLARATWLETKPFSAQNIVSSEPNAALVTTVSLPQTLHELNDDELLALATPHPAVLVRHGPHSAELVFAPPAGEQAP
ncbi:MAG TPA: hypothetical protein VN578_00545 [Candidatus Binatia bacterium]|jgi:hypothetical protein|nr:hypothetical protein [Candidatus Binatia bacterium]